MITEEDLQEAIAECQGQRNPNANTCVKLASFYTIQDHMSPKPPAYSYAKSRETKDTLDMSFSDSDFARAADGKPEEDMWRLMDELMSTIQVLNPHLYDSVMRKVADI